MKKKFMAVFALVLAVALTSYSVSGTYAKYVSEATGSDEARVAKWGVGKTMTVDLFGSSYNNEAVKAGDETDVIAPGTKGVYAFQIKDDATPEVAYKLDVAIEDGSKDETGKLRFWTGDAETYDEASSGGKQYADFNALKSNFGTDLSIAQVKPGETLSSKLGTIKLHWEWQFDGSDDPGDTAKGDAAVSDTSAKAVIKVKVTATQLETVS